MTITTAMVELWINSRSEAPNIEFKEAKNQYDWKELCKYCSAIANEGGGNVVLGIKDKPIPRPITGSKALSEPVKAAERLFEELGFRVEVEEVIFQEKRIVVLTVPPRPRGTAYNYKGSYWMRSGGQLRVMSEDMLRKIFAEGMPDWLDEYTFGEHSLEETLRLIDVEEFYKKLELPLPTEKGNIPGRLKMEKLIDERDGKYVIRRLCAVLFARDFTNFRDLHRKSVRVIVYNGNSKLSTKLEKSFDRGYAIDFASIMDFVMHQLPQNEVIERAVRREVKMVPEIAVRELVANAVIHQDFQIQGATIMVEIYSDRLEVSNPGKPLVDVDRFIDGYQSRNNKLTDLMRRMNFCEERSSGIDKVVSAAESCQLPAPEFKADSIRTIATLYGLKPFKDMNGAERVRACYQHCVLQYVTNQRMTNESLRKRFGLPDSKSNTISQIINAAIQAKKIKPDEQVGSSRKFARYLPYWA